MRLCIGQFAIVPGLPDDPGMDLTYHSERLTLTPFTADDLDLAIDLFTDSEVMTYAGGAMTTADIEASMPDWAMRGGHGCIGVWAVRDRATGEKYGTAALLPIPVEDKETDYSLLVPDALPPGDIEIGYFLKPAVWARGYATEAGRRLLQFAFEEGGLAEVVATFDKGNRASRHVLTKLGFRDHGTIRCYGTDGINFRITREEWLSG